MKTWHWNGEFWYLRDWSLAKRLRVWLIWFGGWERANSTGWSFRWDFNGKLKSPTPLSLFGHRFTHYGWGWNLRLGGRWLVWCHARHGQRAQAYLSDNGTPNRATAWLLNPPQEVVVAAQARQDQRHHSDYCHSPLDVAEEVAGNVWREREPA